MGWWASLTREDCGRRGGPRGSLSRQVAGHRGTSIRLKLNHRLRVVGVCPIVYTGNTRCANFVGVSLSSSLRAAVTAPNVRASQGSTLTVSLKLRFRYRTISALPQSTEALPQSTELYSAPPPRACVVAQPFTQPLPPPGGRGNRLMNERTKLWQPRRTT